MADYITKPTADALNDFANAEEHLSVSEGGDLTVGDDGGVFDIYVALAGTVTVTTSGTLTAAQNDGDEANFFYTGGPSGNIGIDVGSGTYAGTYTTDHAGNTFTLAEVQNYPVCIVAPSVSLGGSVATITPGLWIYDGATIAPLSRSNKLDGVAIASEDGGDALSYDGTSDAAATFTSDETFGITTVTSNSVVFP